MRFIDRDSEQERLRRQLSREGSSFIVIYGRRRLGKSTLIRQVLGERDVYYMAEQNEVAVQLSLLVSSIGAVYPAFAGMHFDSWEGALSAFSAMCEPGSTLVLDEFPYLVRSCPSLPSVLQKLIDAHALCYNLIVCGSSQRMMQKLVLDAAEPLYGRADERVSLQPIGLRHWREAMSLTAREAVVEYSVWGGVPRYWELREREDSFSEAVERIVLDPNGLLHDEPATLFLDEGAGISRLYPSIMTALGNGMCQYSRLASAVGRKTTELSAPLKNLAQMAFVRREVPFGESESKTKKTLWVIDDPFLSFYYRFVAPNKSLLAIGRSARVRELLDRQLSDHVGRVWERLCQVAVSGNRVLGHDWTLARRWWGSVPAHNGAPAEQLEFDVVAESADRSTLLVGECKWTAPDHADRLLAALKQKTRLAPFAHGRQVLYVLFLREKPLTPCDAPVLYPDDVLQLL